MDIKSQSQPGPPMAMIIAGMGQLWGMLNAVNKADVVYGCV